MIKDVFIHKMRCPGLLFRAIGYFRIEGGHTIRTHVLAENEGLPGFKGDGTNQKSQCSPRLLAQYREVVLVCSAIMKVME